MTVTIKLYDDHRSSAQAEGGYPTIYLCDECAQERSGDVGYLNDVSAGEDLYCEDCGRPNQPTEEPELRDAEERCQSGREDMLRKLGIERWEDIRDEFEQADLLLGNGFSINFSNVLDYDSLFEEFLSGCQPEDADMFRSFETTNFEYIQEQLLGARKVNTIFGLPTAPIDLAIHKLRRGLITSVEQNHPRASDISVDALFKVSEALDSFNDVFTFSYDLFLYRIIMISKERADVHRTPRYSDYFWHAHTQEFLEFMDFDDHPNKHVYYLHGALFLFPGRRLDYHNDLKIRRGNGSFDELIEIISSRIERGVFPLFVSEGSPKEKLQTIFESPYLRFAFRKLERSKGPLVVYGWSMADQDKHVLKALKSQSNKQSNKRRSFAVSVYVRKKSAATLEEEVALLKAKLSGHNVQFFDSSTLFAS